MSQWTERIAELDNLNDGSSSFNGEVIIPLAELQVDDVGLREIDKIDRDNEQYKGLKDSIDANDLFDPIMIRMVNDKPTIIDGLHRYCCLKDLGKLMARCSYRPNTTDDDVMFIQVEANLHKVDTKPAQYARQIRHILAMNPHMTQKALANRLRVSSTWVSQRLQIANNLHPEIQDLVDQEQITATNAYYLAKMPQEIQHDWLDRAKNMPPNEFLPAVMQELDNIKRIKRGEKVSTEWTPAWTNRKKTDMQDFLFGLQEQAQANEISDNTIIEAWNGFKSGNISEEVITGMLLGVAYCGQLDPDSVAEKVSKHEEEEAEKRRKQQDNERDKLADKGLSKLMGFKTAPKSDEDNDEDNE
jgi:ParB/RepB/Spo0J family partition protein